MKVQKKCNNALCPFHGLKVDVEADQEQCLGCQGPLQDVPVPSRRACQNQTCSLLGIEVEVSATTCVGCGSALAPLGSPGDLLFEQFFGSGGST